MSFMFGRRKEGVLGWGVECRMCFVDVSNDPVKSLGMSCILGKTWFSHMWRSAQELQEQK